ncbi:iroquois-class homeodomain protein irx-1-A-like [Chiloscyllium plagiosum]|uniref:iroquois-class homeodomain protein irx-1-A-like n=1 Tax=Chiloscyllium plagiosum TaxID=36176 RepID=UPI001CB7F6A2|nr:iroquois-class homeodomain protein irx-1-A-like [Chiloscyllium plagiosum]
MAIPQLGYGDVVTAGKASALSGLPAVLVERQAAMLASPGASLSLGVPPPLHALLARYPGTYPIPQGYSLQPYPDLRHLSHLGSAYDLKAGCLYSQAGFSPGGALYSPYRPIPHGDPGRAKNATRESTSTLKAWLNEHLKNPYPTKGEKIMLAIVTKMTLTQVSTWFANARRRLKKENKMTWVPKTKSDEEESESDEEEGRKEAVEGLQDKEQQKPSGHQLDGDPGHGARAGTDCERGNDVRTGSEGSEGETPERGTSEEPGALNKASSPERKGGTAPALKPKIWSLAETATSEHGRSNRGQAGTVTHYQIWAGSCFTDGQLVFNSHSRLEPKKRDIAGIDQ